MQKYTVESGYFGAILLRIPPLLDFGAMFGGLENWGYILAIERRPKILETVSQHFCSIWFYGQGFVVEAGGGCWWWCGVVMGRGVELGDWACLWWIPA